MLCIRIQLLTGQYAATAYDNRDEAEWPPHPTRLFSALVYQWAANGCDASERVGLEWLETLNPPQIACSPESELARRSVNTHFVPVNDPSKLEVLPWERVRQPRSYPVCRPSDPTVVFMWPDAGDDPISLEHRTALAALVQRLSRLGHSSSMVAAAVTSEVQKPTFVPDEQGDVTLRVPSSGLLAALCSSHGNHQGIMPRQLPSAQQRYRSGADRLPSGLYGEIIPLRFQGRKRLPLNQAQSWCRALRASLISNADVHADFLSGHTPEGEPLQTPHPCFIPLANCGHDHGDSTMFGLGVALPRVTTADQREAVLRALDTWRLRRAMLLYTRRGREVNLEPVPYEDTRWTLQPRRWSTASKSWASVTPVVLSRFPTNLASRDPDIHAEGLAETAKIVAAELAHQQIPTPVRVEVSTSVAFVPSVPPAPKFPVFTRRRDNAPLVKVHVRVDFDERVDGPLIVGSGRHLGYGLLTQAQGIGDSNASPGEKDSEDLSDAEPSASGADR